MNTREADSGMSSKNGIFPETWAPTTANQVRMRKKARLGEQTIQVLLAACALVTVATTLGIIWTLASETFLFFQKVSIFEFLSETQWTPLFTTKHFGIWPLLTATVLAAVIATLVGGPLGLLAAVWLAEYAPDKARRVVKPVLEVLAGIPTVVYGYFALLFVTPFLQRFLSDMSVFNAISPGIVMGIMILPLVASMSEDAMTAVPRSLREAAYALGATRMEVVRRVVLPASASGVMAAFILAVSRAIGETMIVAIAMGQQPSFTLNPLVPMETMSAFIVQISLGDTPHGTLEYQTIFAVGTTLFVMTLILNVISHLIIRHFREVYE